MNILIIMSGDAVQSLSMTPLLGTLSACMNNGIDLLVYESHTALFTENPDVRFIYARSSIFNSKNCGKKRKAALHQSWVEALRQSEYDYVILSPSPSPRYLTFWKILCSDAHTIVCDIAETQSFFSSHFSGDYTLSKEYDPGRSYLDKPLKLYPNLDRVAEVGKKHNFPLFKLTIGIVVNSVSSVCWSVYEWFFLVCELSKCGKIFLIEAPDGMAQGHTETEKIRVLSALSSNISVTNITSVSSEDFLAMMSLCSFVISSDQTVSYIMAALRIPTIALHRGNSHVIPKTSSKYIVLRNASGTRNLTPQNVINELENLNLI